MNVATLATLLGSSIALSALVLGACSSADDAETPTAQCAAYQVPASFDLTTPAVSFRSDVMPILQRSCTASSCHGGKAGGLTINVNDLAAAHKAMVNVPSGQLASMPLVTPGDPAKSYLLRKLDNDACLMDEQCKNGKCGTLMPKNGDVLEITDRDAVRRWIAQGAKED